MEYSPNAPTPDDSCYLEAPLRSRSCTEYDRFYESVILCVQRLHLLSSRIGDKLLLLLRIAHSQFLNLLINAYAVLKAGSLFSHQDNRLASHVFSRSVRDSNHFLDGILVFSPHHHGCRATICGSMAPCIGSRSI